MKKLLFVAAGVFSLFPVSSMDRPYRHKLDEYINSYQDDALVDSSIFKAALLEEIGQDEIAQRMYALFHANEYKEMLDLWLQSNSEMQSENAERFKELLIWLTSIKATEDNFVRWENWNSSWKEKILHVVGDRDAVTKDMFHHLRFCYNLGFTKLVDIGEDGDNFYEFFLCDWIAFYLKNQGIIVAENVVGYVEWDDYYCAPFNIWPNLGDD
jgi:hypothetical protein